MNAVHQLADLAAAAAAEIPARLAVIGFPVKHSASPIMQQPALDAEGIRARYIRLEVPPGELAPALAEMRALGFTGCNVTIPHKLEALAACDVVSDEARQLGAVNTIHFSDGKITGWNTDGPGLAMAVEESFGRPLRDMRVAVMGAGGGAGQAIATMCAVRNVPELVLANRSLGKLGDLAGKLAEISPHTDVRIFSPDDPALRGAIAECDLIVNATSLGMKPDDPHVLPPDFFRRGQFVYDAVYQPAETTLLRDAAAAGCKTANGLAMLLHQGALAFQIWFPGTNPLETMRRALFS